MFLLKKTFFTLIFFLHLFYSFSQNKKVLIHSHNDYLQDVPFWTAYANGLNSIEADIFLVNDTLKIAHTKEEITANNNLEVLYLNPLKDALKNNIGSIDQLQLLLDVKSEPISTLNKIISVVEKYPIITHNKNIKIVISGRRPESNSYKNYPDYIWFDHQDLDTKLSPENWKKVAMVSTSFNDFSVWGGKGRLTHDDYKRVDSIIKIGKKFKKPFRFWGTPDSKTAWRTFIDLGVDVINTDQPNKCSSYIGKLAKNRKTIQNKSEIYKPNFSIDQRRKKIENIILLIGDGNGLSQISAATLANNGELTLTQLKSIGFIKTQAADDFTTDSAAAGTAIATGIKTNNRAIGTDVNGKAIKNIAEVLFDKGYKTGVITTDEITGATPAAFYAHQTDRSMVDEIANDLTKSKLHFFAGGGASIFEESSLLNKFKLLPLNEVKSTTSSRVGVFFSEHEVPSIIDGRKNLLSEATVAGINFLSKDKKPFFLMVEGAQIDSFGHHNNTEGIVTETIDFDTAITEAIKFADYNKETLVIITADHETSGFSVSSGDIDTHTIEGDFITYDHTATMVPVFAYGPYSQEFQGVYENNELFSKILKVVNK
ncbi:alkaline phosphatase [Cellulophaga baltica]|uniref:alkaline phosphatase n=1 Tax=Cellulophaga TaxID=104264 RepID=UPI001C06D0F7|nr:MULTISPECIES: alkaline phosphatase [Cellulophaga]MBU2997319.1 alkaline phosphatase [Cellulophaga baltica]MDO6768717.1 alkaline phosphatase [Cellulophaga sp. 1_MG-2023]